MNHPQAIFRSFLLATSAVSAVFSTRIYVAPLPVDTTFPAISVELVSGDVHGPPQASAYIQAPTQSAQCLLRVWPTDAQDAWALYGTVRDAIAGTRYKDVSGVAISRVMQEGPADIWIDPDDGRQCVQGNFSFRTEV